MPRSEETANSFMSMGRGGSSDSSSNAPVDVCYPQNTMNALGFDFTGGSKMQPAEVDYNPKPYRKNPNSVSDQTSADGLMTDAQGK